MSGVFAFFFFIGYFHFFILKEACAHLPKQDLIFQSWSLTWCLVPFGARHPIRLLSKSLCSHSFGLEVIPPLPGPIDEHLKLCLCVCVCVCVSFFSYFSPQSTPMLHACTHECAHMGIYICKVSDCNSSRCSATEATALPPRPLRISTVPLLSWLSPLPY